MVMVPDLATAHVADRRTIGTFWANAGRNYVAQSSVTVALKRRRLRTVMVIVWNGFKGKLGWRTLSVPSMWMG
jgi:hypothetical protein